MYTRRYVEIRLQFGRGEQKIGVFRLVRASVVWSTGFHQSSGRVFIEFRRIDGATVGSIRSCPSSRKSHNSFGPTVIAGVLCTPLRLRVRTTGVNLARARVVHVQSGRDYWPACNGRRLRSRPRRRAAGRRDRR